MNKKKIILAFSTLFVIGLVGALIFHSYIVRWAVEHYFADKGVKIEFDVNHLNLSGLSISNIKLDHSLNIDELTVDFKSFSLNQMDIALVSLKSKTIDFNEALRIVNKISPSDSNKEEGVGYSALKAVCDAVTPLAVDISVDEIEYDGYRMPVKIQLQKESNSEKISFKASGDLLSSPKPEVVIFDELSYDIKSDFLCGEKNIQWRAKKLIARGENIKLPSEFMLPLLKLDMSSVELTLDQENQVDWKSLGNTEVNLDKKSTKLIHFLGEMKSHLKTKWGRLWDWSLQSELNNLEIIAPYSLKMEKLDFNFSSSHQRMFPISGQYKVDQLNYANEAKEAVVQGLHLEGQMEINRDSVKSQVVVSDDNKIINFKDLNVGFYIENQKLTLNFKKKKNYIKLNDSLALLLPSLSKMEPKGSGQLMIFGRMNYLREKWAGRLSINGQHIGFTSKHGGAKDLKISHTILEYPGWKSSSNRILQAKEISYGPKIQDVSLIYQIKSLSDITIKQLKLTYEEAKIKSKAFRLDTVKKKVKGFEARINHLPLENVLKMGLGKSVTAEGYLSGDLKIVYNQETPLFKGHLRADDKGRIKYRKPGVPAKDFSKITISSMNPMEILESYLYDFYYKKLDIDYASDKNYDMKMTLSTMGNNPRYLDGQKLKLNVNLEQNLLAAFKAMMLTYDLPNKIKDKIENMGAK